MAYVVVVVVCVLWSCVGRVVRVVLWLRVWELLACVWAQLLLLRGVVDALVGCCCIGVVSGVFVCICVG